MISLQCESVRAGDSCSPVVPGCHLDIAPHVTSAYITGESRQCHTRVTVQMKSRRPLESQQLPASCVKVTWKPSSVTTPAGAPTDSMLVT